MDLLTLLSDRQFHSGEALGERLGISRAAVSKQLAHWREQGIEIDVVTGKGYRLRQPLEWLEREAVLAAMSAEAQALVDTLAIERRIASTNDQIMQQLRERPRSGLICLAEQQTAGRGRRGRSWVSPPACNFYGSLSWSFAGGFAAVEGLSLAVGVAVAEALEKLGTPPLQLKWPNDMMHGERKLGGVLLEMQGEAGGPCHLVVGVGINFYLSSAQAESIDRPVGDIATLLGHEVSRNRATGLVLESLLLMLRDYEAKGFAAWRERWQARDLSKGQGVSIIGLADTIEGVADGVDAQGALRVQTATGLQLIHGGEVSLRHRNPV